MDSSTVPVVGVLMSAFDTSSTCSSAAEWFKTCQQHWQLLHAHLALLHCARIPKRLALPSCCWCCCLPQVEYEDEDEDEDEDDGWQDGEGDPCPGCRRRYA